MTHSLLNVTLDLIHHAQRQPDQLALAVGNGGFSYRELDRLTWRAMQHLHDQGLRSGDTVALTFESDFLLAVAMLGAIRLGATVLPIPKSTPSPQRLAWEGLADTGWLASDSHERWQTDGPRISFTRHDLQGIGQVNHTLLSEQPEAPLSISIGSGSTGQPRLMPLTHGQMRGRFQSASRAPIYRDTTKLLRLPSLEYASSQTFFLSMLHLGATYCIIPTHPKNIPALCAHHGINTLGLSVFHAEQLLQHVGAGAVPSPSSIKVQIGGSTVSETLRASLRTHLSEHLHVTYGTNECLFIAMVRSPLACTVSGNVGQPIDGVCVEVVGDNDIPVQVGEAGLLRIKGPGLISGYLNNREQTAKAFKEGWFYPGDVGRLTQDGHIIHLGRADLMMIFNGINIYPAEIENCMVTHPLVKDVFAFPIKHRVHQDVPACAIALKENADTSSAELLGHAQEWLGFKAPKKIFFVNEIPRNEMGKVVRTTLFQMIAAT